MLALNEETNSCLTKVRWERQDNPVYEEGQDPHPYTGPLGSGAETYTPAPDSSLASPTVCSLCDLGKVHVCSLDEVNTGTQPNTESNSSPGAPELNLGDGKSSYWPTPQEEAELAEANRKLDAEGRMIYNSRERTLDMGNRRATYMAHCQRIFLPPPRPVREESEFEMRRSCWL